MNPSRQKFFILSLILSGYCTTLIDSFGQHGIRQRPSIIHYPPVDHHHGQDQPYCQNYSRTNSILQPLYSTTGKRRDVQRKGRQDEKKFQHTKYENKNVESQFAKLNGKITKAESAEGILGILASRKGALTTGGGGGSMSTVNFSTSIHRIARHVTLYQSKTKPGNDRGKILSDPRFALMMCGLAEAILDGAEPIKHGKWTDDASSNGKNKFGPRELANVAWAIAKINIAPPEKVMQVDIDNAESLLREKKSTCPIGNT